jgi:hypothetical protein
MLRRGAALAMLLALSACATKSDVAPQNTLPPGSPAGYIEFYCTTCIAGWAVSKAGQDGRAELGQMVLGRKMQDSMNDPSRMKLLRIAQPPGSFEFVVDLLPHAAASELVSRSAGASKRIQVTIDQDTVTPVRLDFAQETRRSFSWSIKQGRPLPMQSDPGTLDVLASALNDPDWEVRWYATRILGEINAVIPESAIARLKELADKEGYQRCLTTSSVEECSALREAAVKAIKQTRTN